MALTIPAPTKARSFGFSRASAYLPKAYVVATQLDSFSKKEIDAMWRKFKKHGDDGQIRNQLIEFYLPVVRVTAERMSNRLPSHVEVDELIQAGVFGLMDAIDGFDTTRGVKFEIYAKQRIHGAILDDLRSQDFAPRLVRTHSHKLDRAYKAVEAETGAVPEPVDVAAKLEITLEDYDRWMREINMANIISLDRVNSTSPDGGEDMRAGDIIEDKSIAEPMNALEKKELVELATRGLTRKEKLIIVLYYLEELTMKEIGLVLDLSESRVCQIHHRIIFRLKGQLERLKDDLMQ